MSRHKWELAYYARWLVFCERGSKLIVARSKVACALLIVFDNADKVVFTGGLRAEGNPWHLSSHNAAVPNKNG
jgi:hypothetical protein